MKRLTATLALLILILPIAAALDISNYPDQFFKEGEFDAKIVVGEEAPSQDVASAVEMIPALSQETEERISGSVLDSDVTEYQLQSSNIISIGTACDNTVTKQIMGIESGCSNYFTEGEGYIYLYKNDLGRAHLVVAGGTPDDTERAAMVLGQYTEYDLNGNALIVTGDSPPYNIQQTRLPLTGVAEEQEDQVEEVEETVDDTTTQQDTQEDSDNQISERERALNEKIERYTAEEDNTSPEEEQPQEAEEEEEEPDSFLDNAWDKFKEWVGWFFTLGR